MACNLNTKRIKAYDLLSEDCNYKQYKDTEKNSHNCASWLRKLIANSEVLGTGAFGKVFRCGKTDYVIKVTFFQKRVQFGRGSLSEDDIIWLNFAEPIMSRICNKLITWKVCLHIPKTIGSYFCNMAFIPEIILKYGYGEASTVSFIEYVDGKPLSDSLNEINEDQFISIGFQILYTVACLMIYGTVHADLHTGNIMISKTKAKTISYDLLTEKIVINTYGLTVKIIDFGLARYKDSDIKVGVPLYPTGDTNFDYYRTYGLIDDLRFFYNTFKISPFIDYFPTIFYNLREMNSKDLRMFAATHLIQDFLKEYPSIRQTIGADPNVKPDVFMGYIGA